MTKDRIRSVAFARVTRRGLLAATAPLLLRSRGSAAGSVLITASGEGDPPSAVVGVNAQAELQKIYTEPEQAFIGRVLFPANGSPEKPGEENNLAYCHWLIGNQPAMRPARLRLVYELTTYFDHYPIETTIGVINTVRVVDPQNRVFESYGAIARVRSNEAEPRVLLTAAVEERDKAGDGNGAWIHFVTKKFVYIRKVWALADTHVLRVP
jgi:hypothetical protein